MAENTPKKSPSKSQRQKNNSSKTKEYLSVGEVAALAGQSYGTVKRAIDSGALAAYRIGRKFFITAGAAQGYCRQSSAGPEGYTLREIMEKLSLSYAFVSRLVRSGQLKSHKQGRRYIVSEADFQEFMASHQRRPE